MKYLVGVFIVLVLFMGYFINKSNTEDRERLKQIDVARQQKIDDEKNKVELESKIKEIQSKIKMDSTEAQLVLESEKIPDNGKNFYTSLSGRWVDAIKVASSTPRMALAQPVGELQKLKRELETRTAVNNCDKVMQQSLHASFDYAIDGLLAFMQDNEYRSKINSDLSSEYMDKSIALINYCYK